MTTLPQIRKQISLWNWRFWGQWTLANVVAWVVAFWTINKIYNTIWNAIVNISAVIGRPATMSVFGALFGFILGLAQWIVLRRQVRKSGGWIVATAVACSMIWTIPWSLSRPLEKIVSGLLLGFLQWLVLRRHYQGVYWWIIVSGLSWAAGELASQWIVQSSFAGIFFSYRELAGVIIYGLVYGGLSGSALAYFFQVLRRILRLRKISAPSRTVFLASWVAMNAVGWSIGFGSFGQTLREMFITWTGFPSSLIFEKTFLHGLAALFTWLVLWRQWFRGSFWWVIWTCVGAAAGILAWTRLDFENATGILLYGLIVGFFQWLVLSQKISGFWSWMFVHTVGWAVALVIVAQAGQRLGVNIGWGAGGLVYGLSSGALIFWRLRGPIAALQRSQIKTGQQDYPTLQTETASGVQAARVFLGFILLSALGVGSGFAFDIQSYHVKHATQDRESFIRSFPYYTYLQQVKFTDFKQLQRDRQFVWKQFGDGDDFLYHLGEHFVQYYPVQLAHLEDTIAIGEAYIADKQKLGLNPPTNQIYQIIGYYLLGKVAQTLKDEIRSGRFNPEDPGNAQILQRLEQNRIYVTIERNSLQNLISNFKQGKWDYILNRMWLESKEVEQKVNGRYAALLGPDFFEDVYPMPTAMNIPVTETRLQLSAYRQYYPLQQGKEHAVSIFAIQDKSKMNNIGHAVWLRRPDTRSNYFAYGNVTPKFRQWATRSNKTVILATTGGFTNIHNKPEGLTVDAGTIVNAVLMPDRDGLVIVHDSGGISVINLKRDTIKLSLNPQEVLTIENPLHSLIAYSKLLDWCRQRKATLFQTQLLAFSDQLLIDASKAKGQLRERRLLALIRDHKTADLHHVIIDLPTPHNLAVITKDIFDLLQSRGKKVEALLNLDVGSYNILEVYDHRGNALSSPKGPVPLNNATNLIVYTR
ncbi:uncharacterized protein U27_01217 [Candidatus Vecturithrix granuli]|uniref:Uncharacterized protein n=1 Tax=Vecturithrix granuli TaxID=1499967 RepID=A0A081C9R2_VECG1|nr:uncharacterized protein U27_01217 [Candidatus Vecturithrix granuli]